MDKWTPNSRDSSVRLRFNQLVMGERQTHNHAHTLTHTSSSRRSCDGFSPDRKENCELCYNSSRKGHWVRCVCASVCVCVFIRMNSCVQDRGVEGNCLCVLRAEKQKETMKIRQRGGLDRQSNVHFAGHFHLLPAYVPL